MCSKPCPDMHFRDTDDIKKCNKKEGRKSTRAQGGSLDRGFSQFEMAKNVYTSGLLHQYKLSATSKLVLIALVNHYNPKKNDMFPSQKFMANQLGISEKSAERAIKELKVAGLIIYATKKVNHYKFTQKFFDQIKMSDKIRQNVGSDDRQNVGQTNKHEQKNNKEIFFKKKWESAQQPKGIEYPPFIAQGHEVDERTPFNHEETARKYVDELSQMLHIPVIRRKVDEVKSHWGPKGVAI